MMQQSYNHKEHRNILTDVYEGMVVYDHQGDKIGTVKDIYLGALTEEEDEQGLGPATATSAAQQSSLIEDFIQTLSPQEPLPEPLRQQLLRHGFARITSSGLFSSDRYVTPDQIAAASDDTMTLKVDKAALIKR